MSREAVSARILAAIPAGFLLLIFLLIFSISFVIDGSISDALAFTALSLVKISAFFFLFFGSVFLIPAIIILYIARRRH